MHGKTQASSEAYSVYGMCFYLAVCWSCFSAISIFAPNPTGSPLRRAKVRVPSLRPSRMAAGDEQATRLRHDGRDIAQGHCCWRIFRRAATLHRTGSRCAFRLRDEQRRARPSLRTGGGGDDRRSSPFTVAEAREEGGHVGTRLSRQGTAAEIVFIATGSRIVGGEKPG